MKFLLFCLMSLWIADVCKTSQDCFDSPVGVGSLSIIPDNQMSASSQYADGYQAAYGRLNGDRGDGWCAQEAARNDDWLQVDLGKPTKVCALATQGDRNGNEWVKAFKLSYSSDGTTWSTYQDSSGADVEFQRIGDSNTIDQHKLPVRVFARYFRFNPTQRNRWNCLRVEIYSFVCFNNPVGVGSLSIIPDNQMLASSQYGDGFQAAYGRLNGDRGDGWCAQEAARNDDWLQVDLGKPFEACALATQGDRNGNEWVTAFKLSYSSDGTSWNTYQDTNGADVEFQRKGDSNTIDQHKLPVPVSARYFRFNPTQRSRWNCLRVEIYGKARKPCPPGKKTDDPQGRCCVFPFVYAGVSYDSCTSINHNKLWCSFDAVYAGQWANCDCNGALGLENGAIPDGQLSASSEWDHNLNIPQGRLGSPRSWSARINDVNQWYQVDLGSKYTKLTGVGTQGRGDYPQWVQKYKLQYSNDGVNFQYYWEQGQAAEKEFIANADQHTVVYHGLSPPVMARYIRFRILAWHGHISMRAEVYGCPDCNGALGLENGAIPDGQLSASSEWDHNLNIPQGRLGSPRSWSARTNDVNQWYQVDLGSKYTELTGVGTQGRGDYPQWVQKYKLQYSNDGVNFQYYWEQGQAAEKEFIANADQHTVVYHGLSPPVMARYIRFRILAWHGHISMRTEVYGCPGCRQALGMENYIIPDGQISASSEWDVNHAAIQGRLHFKAGGGKQGGWSARSNDVNQWLQVDLGDKYTRVTRVATQGRNAADQWVTKYKLQYSNDGVNFQYYKEQGQSVAKEFVANADRDTVVYHSLNLPITARYVRFLPLAWHNHISMRAELYGCSDINECTNNPCKNGATCVNLQGSYRCDCTSGYSGNTCETDVDECANNPCKNGATCVNLQGSYRCDCKSGYSGNNCETDVDECANNPCQNGATCANLQGSYRCDCKSGYSGNNCETDINECSPDPCQNGGTCVDLVASYRCDCKSGYSGNNCETDINECAPAPCKNGGTCVDLVGSYRCDCAAGWLGVTCEESEIEDCEGYP
ncbi:uncharacterized protein LOC144642352 isoform X2 [Oculina patagonica]